MQTIFFNKTTKQKKSEKNKNSKELKLKNPKNLGYKKKKIQIGNILLTVGKNLFNLRDW